MVFSFLWTDSKVGSVMLYINKTSTQQQSKQHTDERESTCDEKTNDEVPDLGHEHVACLT